MMKNCGLKGKTRKHQNFICVRLTMILMNSCGLDCTLNRCLKILAMNKLHVFWGIYCIRHTPLIALWDLLVDFMSVLILLKRFSHCSGLWPQFFSSFCAVRFRQVWSFCPYSKWPFIENVNRRIWLRCGRGRNLIAPSEQSQRTWLDLEPLLMFSICVVMTFLLTEIIPISFHAYRSLEIHAPVTTTDCWLHSTNSEKEHNTLTLKKVKRSTRFFWEECFFFSS